jgi:hypothetical protein
MFQVAQSSPPRFQRDRGAFGDAAAAVAAAGEFWTARGLGQAGGSISYYEGAKNMYDPKIPKLQGFAIAFARYFLVGDHYAKGKSIRDDC